MGDRGEETFALAAMALHGFHALCEVLVSRTPTSALRGFVTEQLPGPAGARLLGCVLQLANAVDGARAWWQYAAGAGDEAAAYCLYLHHLALGETEAAEYWYQQTGLDICPAPNSNSPETGGTPRTDPGRCRSPTTSTPARPPSCGRSGI
ncbi:hypothetical protein ACFW5D_34835 [Streptomyces sp. NPDC058770]|uniref:hypothetical protein n=1 Tax=unclassified Streptomyces TaxID=2593676 RepID=UPI0036AD7C46